MVGKTVQDSELLEHLYQKLLTALPSETSSFTVDKFYLAPQNQAIFFDVTSLSSTIIDVLIGYTPLSQPAGLIVSAAIKFALRRLSPSYLKGYYLNRDHLWEKTFLTPQEIIETLQKDLFPILKDLNISISLFYARINLAYQTLTYLNCGLGDVLQINRGLETVRLESCQDPLNPLIDQPLQLIHTLVHPGDWFLFCTNEQLKEEAIKIIKSHFQSDAQHLTSKLREKAGSFSPSSGKGEHFLLAIKIKENQFPSLLPSKTAKFSSDLSQLQSVRSFVHQVCQNIPSDFEKIGWELQLAVNEIFCNIVKYGYTDQSKGEILIEAQLNNEGIYFTLSDKGKAFNPSEIKHPNLAGELESGFGFFIVQQLTNQIAYMPKALPNGWNHFRIFKRYFSEEECMQFTHYIQDKILIITPQGENLDAKGAPAFKEGVLELVRATGLSQLIFDLNKLYFIDSSGLGSFLAVQRTLHNQGGKLKLVNLNKHIKAMFELVSMNRIFDIFDTVDEAAKSF
ncbi:anti-sigma factor antagonist [Candidatus Protochlamydia phocaeensis]|uniref:anti-sigma factor antagonist n=1 Tax=Candidatus Protochlamydia phocaeensis TaxID=1414722 RepID=UPI000838DA98|nr:anti-sigma factor antagonist [Candidatus Protochlamydia phocaeensis]